VRIFESAIAIGSVIVAGSLGTELAVGAASTGTGTSKWPAQAAAPALPKAPTISASKLESLNMRGKLAALSHDGKRPVFTLKRYVNALTL
jgi:hypothetical protein